MPLTMYKRGRFWWLSGYAKAPTGEIRVHESTGQTDPAKADQIRFLREKDFYDALILGAKATFTFGDAVGAYIAAGKDGRFLNPLNEHFGQVRISKMTGMMVRDAAKKLYPDAAYTTWNRQVVTPARAVINLSADNGDCPPVKIKGFRGKDAGVRRSTTPPRRAVDRSYIDAFRKHCRNPRLRAMMLFMFTTGARLGDALKLEPNDLDFENRLVTFRDMKNGEDGIADLTVELVYELQAIEPINGLAFGYRARHGFLYKEIKETCVRAGIPYLGTHQPGRHSFATEMIVRHNIDVATTAAKGRWKSKALLMANYVHAETGPSVIDQVFGSRMPVSTPTAPVNGHTSGSA